ncbi:hypothetical protein EN46_01855 [Citrobacter amalonaticus]
MKTNHAVPNNGRAVVIRNRSAHSIKQIADDNGEPMIEVVVNSDCSATDMKAIHTEALKENNRFDWLEGNWWYFLHCLDSEQQAILIDRAHAEALAIGG